MSASHSSLNHGVKSLGVSCSASSSAAFSAAWFSAIVPATAGMVATGAFEIVVGDRTIYSKLETGRLPNAKDVIDGLRRVGLTTPLEAKYLGTAPRSEL